jgi:DNA-binding transcriptional ArsR family regulator
MRRVEEEHSMKLEDIPRRQEVLIVAEAQQRIDRVIVTEHFDRRVASFSEVSHVARAVWIATLRGTPMSAEKIAHTIGMPRATVLRKLDYLIKQGHIRQEGTVYIVADKVLATRTAALDRTIAIILEAADALRAVQTGAAITGPSAT